MQASAARTSRSATTAAAATRPAARPNAASVRPTRPAVRNMLQLSTSTARTKMPRIAAASTNQGMVPPSVDPAMPATNQAPAPSSAMPSAAAFQTDMNDNNAVEESTTRS